MRWFAPAEVGPSAGGSYTRRLAAIALGVAAISSPAALQGQPCDCARTFEAVVEKLAANYVAASLPAARSDGAGYPAWLAAHRRRAGRASPSECLKVVQDFVTYFRDGHLFVLQSPTLSAADSARLQRAADGSRVLDETGVPYTEAGLLDALDRRARAIDPIEGLWYDREGERFAVVPEASSDSSFVALLLEDGEAGWVAGHVKARFTRLADGSYETVYYDEAHRPTRRHVYRRGLAGGGVLWRGGNLLSMAPTTWGKLYPVSEERANRLDPSDPLSPVAYLAGADAVVLSIPSMDPMYADRIRNLVLQFRSALAQRPRLVVDLRGNGGGSSWILNPLRPYVETPDARADRPRSEGDAVVLSSPDNIAYFERVTPQGWVPPTLLARLRASPGRVIDYSEPRPEDPAADVAPVAETQAVEVRGPTRIGLLVDEGVASAGEAYILRTARSTKVRIFGRPTSGTIDYQSVTIVRAGCPGQGFLLGYPTTASSRHLPEGGLNATGIVPDVIIEDMDEDPVETVLDSF